MAPNRADILRLYKELLRYSEIITFTDKNYYTNKIKQGFRANKNTPENITFLYKASFICRTPLISKFTKF